MVKDVRVTYRRRHSYNTKSNRVKVVKTPGGRLTVHYHEKTGNVPTCGDCGVRLHGLPRLRPKQYKNIAKADRTVHRPYGGSRCASCVRDRILRAFLVEERRIVKRVLQQKVKEQKAAAATAPKKTDKDKKKKSKK